MVNPYAPLTSRKISPELTICANPAPPVSPKLMLLISLVIPVFALNDAGKGCPVCGSTETGCVPVASA